MQLEVTGSGLPDNQQLVLRSTDGTQMSYVWSAGAYRCAQIKDRNGNYLTIVHNQSGLLTKITDTLGRDLNVNYDGVYPTSITQTWRTNNGEASGTNYTHTYATFGYLPHPINPTFNSNLTVAGPNGTSVKVLRYINYPTGSLVRFDYNNFGQVSTVTNFASDGRELNYTRTNLENFSTGHTDCPRLTDTYMKVEGFNNSQESHVKNTLTANSQYVFDGDQGTGDMVEVELVGAPYGVKSRTWYHPAGNWAEGLPIGTSDIASGVEKRWTRTVWTQDDANLAYLLNPRVTESKVGDEANVKKTVVGYLMQAGSTTASRFGLVNNIKLYGGATLLKEAVTDYNLDQAYVSRRIIGLVSESKLKDGSGALMSKTTYGYDGGDFTVSGLQQTIAPVQQDNTNYGASFIIGRGNRTIVTRHNVENGSTASTSTQVKYNTAGAPVSQFDPMNRETRIGYSDSFNDNNNSRNTYAYPTKLTEVANTDTNNNFSTVTYRYDIGANVRAQSPKPAGNTVGKITTRAFDSLGRLERQSVWKNNLEYSYTRYDYLHSDWDTHSKVYSTVTDTNGNGKGDAAEEVLTETFTDGASRVLLSRMPLTFDGSGNPLSWSGQKTQYDVLGQVTQQSVPAEVDDSWNLVGDDAVRGDWLWTRQKYDWKGRVTRKINTDGADTDDQNPNDSDILISYEGCGCAGGQQTIIDGELVPQDDDPNTFTRRRQIVYEDALGRVWKTETKKWDGITNYLTSVTQFNGRDQATSVTQTDESAISQVTTMSYDGYGRLKTQHRPEQNQGVVTTYNYNNDDSIQSIVDARGASTVYTHDSRGLLGQISYAKPTGSEIELPSDVIYGYDALGNRISMTDGLGSVGYEYNELSQMKAETRHFSDLSNQAPHNGSYRIEYTYHLGGQLASLKEPFGVKTKYNLDRTGRLMSVAPETAYGTTTVFAQNAEYRAWGALKHLEYGNGTQMNQTFFNNKLQAESYDLSDGGSQIMSKNYDYYSDGKLRHVQDNLNYRFNRLNIYDHVGRIKEAKSSSEADGQTVIPDGWNQTQNLPYRQSYTFNAFGDMTERYNKQWGADSNLTNTYLMTNHKVMNFGWQYDADGRATKSYEQVSGTTELAFNAAGQLTVKHDYGVLTQYEDKLHRYYDGDGREGKRTDDKCRLMQGLLGEPPPEECTWQGNTIGYYVRSTVLGGETISELDSVGTKTVSYMRVGGEILAHLRTNHVWQQGGGYQYEAVYYEQTDASGMSFRTTKRQQPFGYGDYGDERQAEFDSGGTNVGLQSSYQPIYGPAPNDFSPLEGESPMFIDGQRTTCELDGMAIGCSLFNSIAESGGVQISALSRGRNIWGTYLYQQIYDLNPLGLGLFAINAGARIGKDQRSFDWRDWVYNFSQQETYARLPARRLTDLETIILRQSIEKSINDDCKSFIKKLIEQVSRDVGSNAVSTNVLDIFRETAVSRGGPDKYGDSGGIWGFLVPSATNTAGRDRENNNVSIGIAISNYVNDRDKLTPGDSTLKFITTTHTVFGVIHELIHNSLVRGASDEELAIAAKKVLKEDPPEKGLGYMRYSAIWDNRLRRACGVPENYKKEY